MAFFLAPKTWFFILAGMEMKIKKNLQNKQINDVNRLHIADDGALGFFIA